MPREKNGPFCLKMSNTMTSNERNQMRSALVYMRTGCGQWLQPGSGWNVMLFSDSIRNDDQVWNGSDRFIIPECWGECITVRLRGQAWVDEAGSTFDQYGGASRARGVRIDKNGVQDYPGSGNTDFIYSGAATSSGQVRTALITVEPGDYFQLKAVHLWPTQKALTGRDTAHTNWFEIVRVD